MVCASCGAEASGRFCSSCGTALAEVKDAWHNNARYEELLRVPSVAARLAEAKGASRYTDKQLASAATALTPVSHHFAVAAAFSRLILPGSGSLRQSADVMNGVRSTWQWDAQLSKSRPSS
jgi:hypothetical protein